MKVTTALSTLPPRPTLYSKSSIKRSKVNSPTIASSSSTLTNNSNAGSNFSNGSNSNNGGVSKRKDSPLKQSFRRTSPELLAIELKKLNDEKSRLVRESLNLSNNKELVDLLELEYRDDVKNWLFFMEVSLPFNFPFKSFHHSNLIYFFFLRFFFFFSRFFLLLRRKLQLLLN